jgi:hypothetical protein
MMVTVPIFNLLRLFQFKLSLQRTPPSPHTPIHTHGPTSTMLIGMYPLVVYPKEISTLPQNQWNSSAAYHIATDKSFTNAATRDGLQMPRCN